MNVFVINETNLRLCCLKTHTTDDDYHVNPNQVACTYQYASVL